MDTRKSGLGSDTYLNLAEKDLIPNAVIADYPAADLFSFFLCSKIKEPTLHRGIGLSEDLNNKTKKLFQLPFCVPCVYSTVCYILLF